MPPRTTVAIGPAIASPGLLVSVRDAEEALAALAGGADVIDIKEPSNGPLGAAATATVAAVVEAVDGRKPVTVALGELTENPSTALAMPGIAVAKVGLAGADGHGWERQLTEFRDRLPGGVALAAAAYWDWQAAGSPEPDAILKVTIKAGCRGLVLDTWDKTGRSSLSLGPIERIATLVASATRQGVQVVLAGRLTAEGFPAAIACRPRLIGIRGAACDGGRAGRIAEDRVRSLAQRLAGCRSNQ